jgi:Ner family transcriptional regulator
MEREDWHRADVIAGLKKRGWSMASLSRKHGLQSGTLYNALVAPWPKGERLIADAIGVTPQDIWPSRYKQEVQHG